MSSLCCWLASMRWLLCGGDGSKKKTTSVITEKYPARDFLHYSFILIRKNKSALNYSHYSFILIRTINLHHVKSVIIFAEMVSAGPPDECFLSIETVTNSQARKRETGQSKKRQLGHYCNTPRRSLRSSSSLPLQLPNEFLRATAPGLDRRTCLFFALHQGCRTPACFRMSSSAGELPFFVDAFPKAASVASRLLPDQVNFFFLTLHQGDFCRSPAGSSPLKLLNHFDRFSEIAGFI